MEDDVPEEVKKKRLNQIIDMQHQISYDLNQQLIDTQTTVLVEGLSKKSDQQMAGRTDTNKVVIFPKVENVNKGDYIRVRINRATSATLFGDFIELQIPNGEKIPLTA